MPDNLAARLGRWSAAHWKTAVFGWLAFVLAAFVLGSAAGTHELSDADMASGESAVAQRIIAEADFDDHASESVLIHSDRLSNRSPEFAGVVADVAKRLTARSDVLAVRAPLIPEAAALLSKDGHSAVVQFDVAGDPKTAVDRIEPLIGAVAQAQQAHPDYVVSVFGGASAAHQLDKAVSQDMQKAERLSLPVTLVILLLSFGALVAASIPVLLAITAVIGSLGLSTLASHLVPSSSSTSAVILMIGMAVGVDYSLFYLRREREERDAGADPRTALLRAAATSGHAVLVSGVTVLIAMAGMLIAGNPIFTSMSVGTMLVVFVAMVGSVTAVPALLGRLGHNVEKGRLPFLGRRRGRDGAAQGRIWGAILTPVLRRPLVAALGAGLFLVALALPGLDMRTQLPGYADLPENLSVTKTYNALQKAFPGASEPAYVVVKAKDVTAPAVAGAIEKLHRQAVTSGQMSEPVQVQVNQAKTVAMVSVPLAGKGQDSVSNAALTELRTKVVPATVGQLPGVEVAVTGQTAGTADFNTRIQERAPWVFGFVLGLAFLLLLMTFRSLVVPAKAILLNLLSVGAAYGILVGVFQRGWGASLLGVQGSHPIASWLPMFLFVILFGLSMDYHVFILSRVKELVDRGHSTVDAVEQGIRSTAGTVTSAAVIMVAVFAIFASLQQLEMKQMGVGLAAAVLIDATIIRGVLLPASMKLLGESNWYLPSWLQWLPGGHRGLDDLPVVPSPRQEAKGTVPV
ncbi:MAG: family transporter [Frankiales bacterium]|nr:family transporter [Frankiales bacterium]